ncbi:MAG: YggS family pyridoxal phosphate-dependent enzyme [Deferribacteraceae bacterium]|jgi:pyridoxal phosphate enzyme (YggS family)|nr:YggS family pyridoxal phosphate-dependent enzyme [Deferribacteraceae bacterium]
MSGYQAVRALIPSSVTLLAVSKMQSIDSMCELAALGADLFGESRVQEALPKIEALPNAKFHFIGKLQSNKIRAMIGKFALIHSVDNLSIAQKIDREAAATCVIQDILIQINLAREPQKGGVYIEALEGLVTAIQTLPNVRLKGFMMIPPMYDEPECNRHYFSEMKEIFDRYRTDDIDTLSMGMSDDFTIAIEEGATMVRVGTALFGKRS